MNDPLTNDAIEAIKARCEQATAGPWKSLIEAGEKISGSDFIQTGGEDIYLTGATRADQDFIAHAQQDIPRLIAEIERLKLDAKIERLKANIERLKANKSHLANDVMETCISVMRSNHANTGVMLAAARLLVTDVNFHARMAGLKIDRTLSEDWWMAVLEDYDDLTQRCRALTSIFATNANRENLQTSLGKVAAELDTLPKAIK